MHLSIYLSGYIDIHIDWLFLQLDLLSIALLIIFWVYGYKQSGPSATGEHRCLGSPIWASRFLTLGFPLGSVCPPSPRDQTTFHSGSFLASFLSFGAGVMSSTWSKFIFFLFKFPTFPLMSCAKETFSFLTLRRTEYPSWVSQVKILLILFSISLLRFLVD